MLKPLGCHCHVRCIPSRLIMKVSTVKHLWSASHQEVWTILDYFDPFVFRATCAIPAETSQRPSGFCLQLSFFLSGMSLANSRSEIWFSFNAIDASVSCYISLICNGNVSNHSSPHSVFGRGIISRNPEQHNVKIYLLWDKSCVPCEYISAIWDVADKEERSLLQQLAQLCVSIALPTPSKPRPSQSA